jgi:hypothetical protein
MKGKLKRSLINKIKIMDIIGTLIFKAFPLKTHPRMPSEMSSDDVNGGGMEARP